MLERHRALLAVLALAAACTGNPDVARPTPTADDSIELARGPCFGACPVYTVTIYGDGRVVFRGERFVTQSGEHTRTIDAAAAAALFAEADSIGFFRMPAAITPANAQACGASWTDMPSADITVWWAGRQHEVAHYHGCPKAPPELTAFENRIDAVAGTAQWTGGAHRSR